MNGRHEGRASLVVDFSTGVTKSLPSVSLDPEGGIWAALADRLLPRPGLEVEYAEGMVSRAGHHRTRIESIDGVKSNSGERRWVVWVNGEPAGAEITYHLPNVTGRAFSQPRVDDGDAVLIKLQHPVGEAS